MMLFGYLFYYRGMQSLIAKPKFEVYWKYLNILFMPHFSQHTIKFRTGVHSSLRTFTARLPLQNKLVLEFQINAVLVYDPFFYRSGRFQNIFTVHLSHAKHIKWATKRQEFTDPIH